MIHQLLKDRTLPVYVTCENWDGSFIHRVDKLTPFYIVGDVFNLDGSLQVQNRATSADGSPEWRLHAPPPKT